MAEVMKVVDWPSSHCMPAARLCTADQVPEPHCWKEEPEIQFHMPSVVHADPTVWEPVAVLVVEVVTGVLVILVLSEPELLEPRTGATTSGADDGAALAGASHEALGDVRRLAVANGHVCHYVPDENSDERGAVHARVH